MVLVVGIVAALDKCSGGHYDIPHHSRLDFPLAEEPIDASAVATAALDEITAVFSALQNKPKVGDVLCRQWVAEIIGIITERNDNDGNGCD